MHLANPALLYYREKSFLKNAETKLSPKASNVCAILLALLQMSG